MTFDIESLIEIIEDFHGYHKSGESLPPHNPVVRYDSNSGVFSLESELYDGKPEQIDIDTEHFEIIFCDYNDKSSDIRKMVSGLDKKWIEEIILKEEN